MEEQGDLGGGVNCGANLFEIGCQGSLAAEKIAFGSINCIMMIGICRFGVYRKIIFGR